MANLFGTTVAKIASSGGAATTFGTLPTGASGQAIAVDGSGNVFVGTAQGAIYRFNSNGVRNSTPLVSGYAGGISALASGLARPRGIAVQPSSAPATPPTVTTHPQSQTTTVGSAVTFTVAAAGTTPISYQWQKGGANISGATNATLTLSNVQSADAGIYSVVVINSAGSTTSVSATLTVNEAVSAPTITTQPRSQGVRLGGTASFSVVATGGGLSYQWIRAGGGPGGRPSAVVGSASTLTLTNVQSSDAGAYSCQVRNALGSVTSESVSLTVITEDPPQITSAPAGVTVQPGKSATLAVTASSAGLTEPTFASGQAVTMTAKANPGSYFTGWDGDLKGTDPSKTLLMEGGNKSVTATFTAGFTVNVIISALGSGSGTVELTPPGGVYKPGDEVTVTAKPASGSTVTWGGDLSGSTLSQKMTVDRNKTITAVFNLAANDSGQTNGRFEIRAVGTGSFLPFGIPFDLVFERNTSGFTLVRDPVVNLHVPRLSSDGPAGGSFSGSLSANGALQLTTHNFSDLGSPFGTYEQTMTYSGTITISSSGAATGSGTWAYSETRIETRGSPRTLTGSGTWTLTRRL